MNLAEQMRKLADENQPKPDMELYNLIIKNIEENSKNGIYFLNLIEYYEIDSLIESLLRKDGFIIETIGSGINKLTKIYWNKEQDYQ